MQLSGPQLANSILCFSTIINPIHSLKMVKTAAAGAAASNAAEVQRGNNELKYKGVRKRKWGKYVSEVRLPNSRERIWLGSYDTAEKAARAFDAALFCLRGPNAKFNFPDDPPNIAGWQSLTPADIQVMAQHYGNTYGGGGSQQPPPEAEAGPRAPSSNSEGAGPMEYSIDWSFLDVLGSETAGHVSDFGLFHEPGDMYLPPPPHLNEDDDNDDDSGNGGNVPSFLWNF